MELDSNLISNVSIEFRFAKSIDDLKIAKIVDDAAFGIHHGISMEELIHIIDNGFILMIFDRITGECIGQSQILLSTIPELPFPFAPSMGYCYGIAIHPEKQGRGIGKVLACQQEQVLLSRDIKELCMTVRVENYNNLRLMTKLGHRIYHYDRNFYGHKREDARVYLKKSLVLNDSSILYQEISDLEFVPVNFGDLYDQNAHEKISELLYSGFQGVYVDRRGIYFKRLSD